MPIFALLFVVACDGGAVEPVSFANDVQPIFARNCVNAECHGSGNAGGLDLSESAAWQQLVGIPAVQLNSMERVAPGDADNSYLVHKLENTQAAVGGSGTNMSPGLGLAQNEIDLIRRWIDEGAEDN